MSDEESYEYEYDDDDMDEGGFQYTDDEEEANDTEVALGAYIYIHGSWVIVLQLCSAQELRPACS